jgi:hypothetical protein
LQIEGTVLPGLTHVPHGVKLMHDGVGCGVGVGYTYNVLAR